MDGTTTSDTERSRILAMNNRERIHEAAYIKDGVVYSVPRPQRHCHVHWIMNQLGVMWYNSRSGFTTTWGRYVDRKEAWEIAKREGQVIDGVRHVEGMLFSEDLWEGGRELHQILLQVQQDDMERRPNRYER
jgi:hypothetical protein